MVKDTMRIKVLGCSGGIGAKLRTTSLLIDDDVLLDAGTGVGDLSIAELEQVNDVFLTHSHLDHVACLPLLIDTIFDSRKKPVTVHGRTETLDALKSHVFNWVIWPDFSVLPNTRKPSMQYQVLRPGQATKLSQGTLSMVEVNHTVPGAGYILQADNKALAFSGDTAANDNFWQALNALPQLDVLIVETAFANDNRELAWMARHYCPETLAKDIRKLQHDPLIYITHLKPGAETQIMQELHDALPQRKIEPLQPAQEIIL
ncbi:MAG TPA: 3',5'-cyclic-nucleotide phosphodiesterase [Gammaproteobacteria bacterium]|nr:3',5'-cyclic-nucleotide phosphodiesterase [Gammaproteobacteria bacterium]